MFRVGVIAAGIAAWAMLAAGCAVPVGGASHVTWQHPITTAVPTPTAPSGLLVLPPSSHVTGTYPAHCTAGTDMGDHAVPDAGCTPGSVRSDVTEANLTQNVCLRGWTATVRPPEAETDALKTQALTAYGDPASARGSFELDHFVPLELGGSSDVTNLWPEPADWPNHPPYEQNHKDQVENDLKAAVCDHKVQLSDAQSAIATDWSTAEHVVGIGP